MDLKHRSRVFEAGLDSLGVEQLLTQVSHVARRRP